MRSLVTGATSFVGTHLVHRLLSEGHEVRAIVAEGASARPGDVASLSELGIDVIETGTADPEVLAEAARDTETVFHLPWRGGSAGEPEAGAGAMIGEFSADLSGAEALIEACRTCGVRRLVHCGTVAVYGPDSIAGPKQLSEDDPVMARNAALGPFWQRFVAPHIAVEALIRAQLPPPDYVILRSSMVYGSGSRFSEAFVGRAIGLGGAAFGAPRTVQWVHVADFVTAMLLAAETTDGVNETFNIAGAEAVSEAALRAATQHIALAFDPSLPDDPEMPTLNPLPPKFDIGKARDLLGFEPEVPLARGIEEVVAAIVVASDWGQEGNHYSSAAARML